MVEERIEQDAFAKSVLVRVCSDLVTRETRDIPYACNAQLSFSFRLWEGLLSCPLLFPNGGMHHELAILQLLGI